MGTGNRQDTAAKLVEEQHRAKKSITWASWTKVRSIGAGDQKPGSASTPPSDNKEDKGCKRSYGVQGDMSSEAGARTDKDRVVVKDGLRQRVSTNWVTASPNAWSWS